MLTPGGVLPLSGWVGMLHPIDPLFSRFAILSQSFWPPFSTIWTPRAIFLTRSQSFWPPFFMQPVPCTTKFFLPLFSVNQTPCIIFLPLFFLQIYAFSLTPIHAIFLTLILVAIPFSLSTFKYPGLNNSTSILFFLFYSQVLINWSQHCFRQCVWVSYTGCNPIAFIFSNDNADIVFNYQRIFYTGVFVKFLMKFNKMIVVIVSGNVLGSHT